jgi:hypothetical protein
MSLRFFIVREISITPLLFHVIRSLISNRMEIDHLFQKAFNNYRANLLKVNVLELRYMIIQDSQIFEYVDILYDISTMMDK